MNMKAFKYIAYAFAVALCLSACSGEEELNNNIDYPNYYTLKDNPSNAVEHRVYEIYQKYGVPVFFNDTVAAIDKGIGVDGAPLIQYETLDLNWGFESYNRDTKYTFQYMGDDSQKLQALSFVEAYLEKCSRPMRPFSIMLADTLFIKSASKTDKPLYHVGFRTVVFTQLADVTAPETVDSLASAVIQSMVIDRVAANEQVVSQFAEVSNKLHYYNKRLDVEANPAIMAFKQFGWMFTLGALYDDPPYKTAASNYAFMRNLKGRLVEEGYAANEEDAQAIIDGVLDEMGKYGFIRESDRFNYYTPGTSDEDRKFFMEAMLYLGEKGFEQRYGRSPLVMQKFRILRDYVKNELGVTLNGVAK